jgi:hypothetical protein
MDFEELVDEFTQPKDNELMELPTKRSSFGRNVFHFTFLRLRDVATGDRILNLRELPSSIWLKHS